MTATNKRLEFLQRITSSASADSFAWYGLAMEYRSLGRHEEALSTFEKLRSSSPDYVPMYLMCGQMLEKMGRTDDARAWMRAGIEAATRKSDAHAASELEAALAAIA